MRISILLFLAAAVAALESGAPRQDFYPEHGEGRLIWGHHAITEPLSHAFVSSPVTAGRRLDGSWVLQTLHPEALVGQSVLLSNSSISNAMLVPEIGAWFLFPDGVVRQVPGHQEALADPHFPGSETRDSTRRLPRGVMEMAGFGFGRIGFRLRDGTVVQHTDSGTFAPTGIRDAIRLELGEDRLVAIRKDGSRTEVSKRRIGRIARQADSGAFRKIVGNYDHALGLRKDGRVSAWGNEGRPAPKLPDSLGEVLDVAAGTSWFAALGKSGTVSLWGHQALAGVDWGQELAGIAAMQAGGSTLFLRRKDGSSAFWNFYNYHPALLHASGKVYATVAVGSLHGTALTRSGFALDWGAADQHFVGRWKAAVAAAAGFQSTLFLTADGDLVETGSRFLLGKLGGSPRKFLAVSAQGENAIALDREGRILDLARASAGSAAVPAGLPRLASIAAGAHHSLAVTSEGRVHAWGRSLEGQAGIPYGMGRVRQVAAGSFHSLALTEAGTVLAWGDDRLGQCQVPAGLGPALEIRAAGDFSAALLEDGRVVTWGADGRFRREFPEGLRDVKALALGRYQSAAVGRDGALIAPPFRVEAGVPEYPADTLPVALFRDAVPAVEEPEANLFPATEAFAEVHHPEWEGSPWADRTQRVEDWKPGAKPPRGLDSLSVFTRRGTVRVATRQAVGSTRCGDTTVAGLSFPAQPDVLFAARYRGKGPFASGNGEPAPRWRYPAPDGMEDALHTVHPYPGMPGVNFVIAEGHGFFRHPRVKDDEPPGRAGLERLRGVWLESPAGYLCVSPPAPDGPTLKGFQDIDGNGHVDAVLGPPESGFTLLLFRSGRGFRAVTMPAENGPAYCC